ncbi:hypothetical protein LARI1_G003133 [Lachnellula arida]|uniref:EF-hand domain-containing protein n=1 Tax=Lachnellula arida TaxID=1316785 RepID=A0A8T9BDQ3_9HELO|nr:hypothetical protein LARI1_G003133 [Lachnellula arida]
MPLRLSTWTSIFMIFGLFNLVSSSQAVLDSASINTPQTYYRICPLPRCERCPSDEEIRAPGVGFALETSHGAAVVRLHDGAYQRIALIKGDASYTTLLRRLATGPENRTPDHFDSNWKKLQYVKARTQRHLNKLLGRPATSETAILATMVSALYNETQTWLGGDQPIAAAVLSSPDRIRLTDEEINDVFDYLKLKNLMAEPDSLEDLYATSAAYAGYGLGLCTTYTDAYACEREEWRFPFQYVLHVDFNRESLSATIKRLQSARDGSVAAAFVDPDLGHAREEARLALAPESDGELYWASVSTRIRELVMSFKPGITELLLTGTSATDARFKAALRDALHDIVGEDVLAVFDSDGNNVFNKDEWKATFDFATARGAAEVAKRRQEGPVRCAQSDECKERRGYKEQAVLQNQGTDIGGSEQDQASFL